jgi:hypothetical protein
MSKSDSVAAWAIALVTGVVIEYGLCLGLTWFAGLGISHAFHKTIDVPSTALTAQAIGIWFRYYRISPKFGPGSKS